MTGQEDRSERWGKIEEKEEASVERGCPTMEKKTRAGACKCG